MKSGPGEATISVQKESSLPMTFDILLVDDNMIQAATRKAILARSGRSVTVASNGQQALDYLHQANMAPPVGLVITDHLMPGMNGPQFVAGLREIYPELPVLVLSGMADAEGEYDGFDVIFRVKPYPPDELISLVRSLLATPIGRTA